MKKLVIILAVLTVLFGCSKNSGGDNYYVAPGGADYSMNLEASQQVKNEEKLVYTGSVRLETRNFEESSQEITDIIKRFNAVTQSMREQTSDYDNTRYLYLTVRVPAADYNAFLEALKSGSGTVKDIQSNVDNITKQYNDNEIEITSLEAQHERLLELMKTAENLSDIIQLEERISQVEADLNKHYTYRNQMDADVAYSTVTITLSEKVRENPQTFLQRVADAFGGSWENFVRGVQDFIIDVIYALPVLIIIAILFFLLRKPVVNFFRKRREKKNS